MFDTIIDCAGLSKEEINKKINNITEDLINTKLIIISYDHDDFEGIKLPRTLTDFECSGYKIKTFKGLILPTSLLEFSCVYTNITSFDELKLPDSLLIFNCHHNSITSFIVTNGLESADSETSIYSNIKGLILPQSLTHFSCSNNQITSFVGLTLLPDSLQHFYCDNNKITSFFIANEFELTDGEASTDNVSISLKLPPSLIHFSCSNNPITSFTGLTLPPSLKYFYCSTTKITSLIGLKLSESLIHLSCHDNHIVNLDISSLDLPETLTDLGLDSEVNLINPKFNSVLQGRLKNKVISCDKVSRRNLIFLYFNIKKQGYLTYDRLISLINH
jgi:Leucine-rich repeat (LRR) protein